MQLSSLNTTAHPWWYGHSTSMSACGVWGIRVGVQVSRSELHTHIHLNYIIVEFYLVYIYIYISSLNYMGYLQDGP